MHKTKARMVCEYLLKTFRLRLCKSKIGQGCLYYHLNQCAGNCTDKFKKEDYIFRIQLAQKLIEGKFEICRAELIAEVTKSNKHLDFEKSRNLNEYLQNLETIFQTLKTGFTEKKYSIDIASAVAPLEHKLENAKLGLLELQKLLNLIKTPVTIDCFDISHFQSSYIVGSCVRSTLGFPDKNSFRRFKIKSLVRQDDYKAMREIVSRRYKNPEELPDIILIDGGKGQLSAVQDLFPETQFVAIAKREETLFADKLPAEGYKLDPKTNVAKLLISLRDYAHHFAVSYHKLLRHKNF